MAGLLLDEALACRPHCPFCPRLQGSPSISPFRTLPAPLRVPGGNGSARGPSNSMASYNSQPSAPVQEALSGPQELQLPRRSNRFKSMPYVVYSNSKREVSGQELAMLFAAAKEPYMTKGSFQKASYYAHWPDSTAVVNPRIAPRLALAVERSVAVVAAFTNFDVYASPSSTAGAHGSNTTGSSSHPSGQSSSQQGGPSLGHGAAQSQTHSLRNAPGTDPQPSPLQLSSSLSPPAAPWQPWSRPRTAAKRSLVGFARAAGDGALAATIYDLAVHPDFRGFGVGQKLLRLLVQQLYQKGVYDIGSVPPLEVSHTFAAASFEDDRELSTTMTFTLHHGWAQQGLLEGHGMQSTWAPSWARPDAGFTTSGCSSTSASGQQDLLARVPAPASEEVRRSGPLQKLLLRRMEQVLGPIAPVKASSVERPQVATAVTLGPERQQVQQVSPNEREGSDESAVAPAPHGGSDGMIHHGSSSWEWTGSQQDVPQQKLRSPVSGSYDGGTYEI